MGNPVVGQPDMLFSPQNTYNSIMFLGAPENGHTYLLIDLAALSPCSYQVTFAGQAVSLLFFHIPQNHVHKRHSILGIVKSKKQRNISMSLCLLGMGFFVWCGSTDQNEDFPDVFELLPGTKVCSQKNVLTVLQVLDVPQEI